MKTITMGLAAPRIVATLVPGAPAPAARRAEQPSRIARWCGVLGLALLLLVPVAAATAQDARSGKPVRIGRLSPLSAATDAPHLQAFRKALGDLGWREGIGFVIEERFADGKPERLEVLAADLVRRQVDLILVGSTPGALAVKKATSTIPVVMVTTGDPVEAGIVASLARPGGNITGVTGLAHVLKAKRLELLKEALPGVSRVAVLANPTSPYTPPFMQVRERTARTLGLAVPVHEVRDRSGIAAGLQAIAAERPGAVMVLTDVMFITERRRIVELLTQHRLPAVYPEREFVDAGGLMFYGASLASLYRHAAVYADRILKGARPADLPVEQPTTLELLVNLTAAKAIGLTLPPSVLARADRLIE
ncbi:MAG TPA: ABC transporter substrate-binding protein [Methylomirabilota bacterium]|nr:ABC transporter substrate-binding protein [Methylomirabilota bacterium]